MKQEFLTPTQLAKFNAGRQRFLVGLAMAVGYCIGVVLADEFVGSIAPYGLWITLGGFVAILVAIFCTWGYRCPVCNLMPMTGGILSTGSADVSYSSMVALAPKKCRKCGVQFRLASGSTGEPITSEVAKGKGERT